MFRNIQVWFLVDLINSQVDLQSFKLFLFTQIQCCEKQDCLYLENILKLLVWHVSYEQKFNALIRCFRATPCLDGTIYTITQKQQMRQSRIS